ncbi:MAG: thioredoxin domain-containing protein [Bacteroidales bacterium]|nr:thioredoxin domain-containing protein [Bacteroidales bacterium]
MNKLVLILVISLLANCSQSQVKEKKPTNMEKHKYSNKLAQESSPYLLQHAHNPVNWYPWGEEALNKAKDENKLILISIGYAACHWCHVMERESFEDEQVAVLMNEHFVCIKVDREERPDIDQIYMTAVQMMTGSGGWPLNCFALPDGRPVYGGTYFRKDQWKHVLTSLSDMYQSDKQKMLNVAADLSKGIIEAEVIDYKVDAKEYSDKDLKEIVEPWKPYFDKIEGGNDRAPKFPLPNSYEFLLNYSYYTSDKETLEHVYLTLNKMAKGGIYDQAGGGFARYSVDKYWKAPHFEKMLYDNGQLVSLYSKAYQLSKNEDYKRVVYHTIEFLERELRSSEGAFYSSLDADSEGEEGKFYVWDKKELEELLGENAKLYCDYYKVNEQGNWENNKNILHRGEKEENISKKYHLSNNELIIKIESLNAIVLKARAKRIRPSLDDKILSSWNGLMLKGLIDAYRVFDEPVFLQTALENAEFISNKMIDKDYRLWRNYKNGKASINGFLDDYAFVIDGFIALYQATFEEKWLNLAKNLTDYTLKHFHDDKSGMLFYTSDLDPKLIARKMEINDNVIPGSNSAMAKNLYYLGHFFYNDNYIEISSQMLHNVKDDIKRSGAYYSNWALLLTHFVYNLKEVAIVGKDALPFRKKFDENYLPQCIFSGSTTDSHIPMLEGRMQEGKTTIYVCENRVCKLPVYGVEEAVRVYL